MRVVVFAFIVVLFFALTGCYASHQRDANAGVVCGDAICPIDTACVLCPDDTPDGGGPRCRVMPASAPDFWTWAYECSPDFAPRRSVDAFLCDGPEDCEAPERCLRSYPGSRCDVPCLDCDPPAIVCHVDDDCDPGRACTPDEAYGTCR